jgi:hypothetical protein
MSAYRPHRWKGACPACGKVVTLSLSHGRETALHTSLLSGRPCPGGFVGVVDREEREAYRDWKERAKP